MRNMATIHPCNDWVDLLYLFHGILFTTKTTNHQKHSRTTNHLAETFTGTSNHHHPHHPAATGHLLLFFRCLRLHRATNPLNQLLTPFHRPFDDPRDDFSPMKSGPQRKLLSLFPIWFEVIEVMSRNHYVICSSESMQTSLFLMRLHYETMKSMKGVMNKNSTLPSLSNTVWASVFLDL